MGCGCNAGGGKADLKIYAPSGESVTAGINDDPSNWVTVEYIGAPVQIRTMRSSSNRGRSYRYGGESSSPERVISVLREDVSLFLSRPNDFRVIESAPQKDYEVNVAVRAAPANTPAIFAERKPVAIDRMGLRVLAGRIPPEVLTLLEEAGYKNVLGLRNASKADLLAIKGIGDRRANQILGAVGGLH